MIFTIPNLITLIRILLTPLFIYFLFVDKSYQIFALITFIVASITDAYDGHIARKYSATSRVGKFLDPLADKILICAAFISLVILRLVSLWMVVLVILRDVVITILRIVISRRGLSMSTSKSAKIKTTIQVVVIYIFLSYYIVQSWNIFDNIAPYITFLEDYYILKIIMLITTLFTVLTGIQYIYINKKAIADYFKG